MYTHILKITGLLAALGTLLLGALGLSMYSSASTTEPLTLQTPPSADECSASTATVTKEKKSFFVSCGGFF